MTVSTDDGSHSKSDSKLISVEAGRSQSQGVLVDVNAKNMQNGTALHVHSEGDHFSGTLMKISSSATTFRPRNGLHISRKSGFWKGYGNYRG